jgi:TBCC domain-containing protein 1
VCVSNCSDCTVILGAVGTLLRLENCERLQLVAAAGQVQVVSCHSCTLYLGTIKPPVLLGDCRFVTLAPHNTRYEFIQEHMAAAGLPTGGASLWNQPIVVSNTREGCVRKPCGATPSSPLTHGSGGAGRGGSAGPKPMLLMPPEDFLPLVVPFRWVVGEGVGVGVGMMLMAADQDRVASHAWMCWCLHVLPTLL